MSVNLLDKKEVRIQKMFAEIAPKYDFLNHLLSFNIDRYWRWHLTRKVTPLGTGPILDLCTGTGDVAFAYERKTKGNNQIIAADFCYEMLALGERKSRKRKKTHSIQFLQADAQELPFDDNTFEISVISFGLRNVTDTNKGLSEMVRVTKRGGSVGILEFSSPRNPIFSRIYRFYFQSILPKIGQLISRSPDSAYLYLPASVLEFPDGEKLAAKLRDHGLINVTFQPLTLGIATLYTGQKPKGLAVDENA